MPAEQPTGMFCRSDQQGTRFIMLLICSGCCFILVAIQLKIEALPMYGNFARARSAWYETCQRQNRLVLASCVLLPFRRLLQQHAMARVHGCCGSFAISCCKNDGAT
eukprot:1930436-Amphidinium_carterae.1